MPTVADLRARRLELTRASLRERLLAGDLDRHARRRRVARQRVRHRRHRGRGGAAGARGGGRRRGTIARFRRPPRRQRQARGATPPKSARGRAPGERTAPPAEGDMVRLFVGAGRRGGDSARRSRRRDHRRDRHPVARDRRDRDQRRLLAGRGARGARGRDHRRAAGDEGARAAADGPSRALTLFCKRCEPASGHATPAERGPP